MRPAVWKTGPMRIDLLASHHTHAAAALCIKYQPNVVWQRRPSTTLSAIVNITHSAALFKTSALTTSLLHIAIMP